MIKVIKLGGSLVEAGTLTDCLQRITQRYQHSIVIVPGGGLFAEQVRLTQQVWRFNNDCAHAMALLAMQQTAWLIKGLQPTVILENSIHKIAEQAKTHIVVWLPELAELNQAAIPATWDITSDSLAAWLAKTLCANDLILVKSRSIDETLSVEQLQQQGIVDAAFTQYVHDRHFLLRIVNQRDF